MHPRAAVAAIALAGAAVVGPAAPSYASCSADAGPSGQPVVFVGTVDGTRGGFTRFAVDEVWTGPDLAPEVWLLTGQRDAGVGGSDDADLSDGARYVVGASADFQSDACLVWTQGRGGRAPVRPSSVRSPEAAGSDGADPPTSPVAWLARVVGVVAGGFLALRGVLALHDRRRAGADTHGELSPVDNVD